MRRAAAAAALLLAASPAGAGQLGIEGRAVRAELHGIAQVDWRDPPAARGSSRAEVPRARIGVTGAFFTRVEYEVEHDFRNHDQPWRDAYLNARFERRLEIRAGRFKVPFSQDQQAGAAELDFLSRSLAARHLAPGRDVGLMAHGRVLARRLRFQAGVFRTGGDNVRADERRDPRHGALVAGRLGLVLARGLALGIAATRGHVPDGTYSLRGETAAEALLFPAVSVHGLRRRYGGEIDWRAGPVSLGGEVIRAVDERRDSSTDDTRLPDIVAHGWYVRATWLVTGERKTDRVRPARPAPRAGRGAVEVAARLEDLSRASRGTADTSTTSTRSDRIVPAGDRAVTLGVTWYLTRALKLQGNVFRDWRREGRAAVRGPRSWSPMLRMQVAL